MTFARSQLDGLTMAEEAARFALEQFDGKQVSLTELPLPNLIDVLRTMLDTVREFHRVIDKDSPLYGLSFSSDGKWLAASSFNGRVYLLDLENRQQKDQSQIRTTRTEGSIMWLSVRRSVSRSPHGTDTHGF